MIALFACLIATQVPIDQPTRLRTVLPNGAAVFVEQIPQAKTLSMQLFVSSRGTEETPISNGLRHLLEHLVAKGPKGDLDTRLESAGAFLQAETSRDAMVFNLNLPPGRLELGVRTVAELMQMPVVTTDAIKHEALVLEQEMALRDDQSKFSSAAWTLAYGDKGLDPVGNLDVIRNATPEMLDKLHRAQFVGSNLVVSVVGNVDLDSTTKACLDLLSKFPKVDSKNQERTPNPGGRAVIGVPGRAYAVSVPGWRHPEMAARLAAAFALASETDNCFVTYTPSAKAGVVIVGCKEGKDALREALVKAVPNALYLRGQNLAKLWVSRLMNTPDEIASLRGLLITNAVDLKPDTLIENLNAMTPKQFAAGLDAFRSADTYIVEGR